MITTYRCITDVGDILSRGHGVGALAAAGGHVRVLRRNVIGLFGSVQVISK